MADLALPKADPHCCLYGLGSVNTPFCIVWRQKEFMMGKAKKLAIESDPGACAGMSLVEMMEYRLDGLMEYLMQSDMETADPEDIALKKGEATGVATCIAIIRTPYDPNVIAVKAEAVERYEWNHRNDEVEEESDEN